MNHAQAVPQAGVQGVQGAARLHIYRSGSILIVHMSDAEDPRQAYGQFCHAAGLAPGPVEQTMSINTNNNQWNVFAGELVLEYVHRHRNARVYRNRQESFVCTDSGSLFEDVRGYVTAVIQPVGGIIQ